MAAPTHRGPRIVFVTDGRFASGGGRFAWRLDAANNRPLGRSAGTTRSFEDCCGWLVALRADVVDDADAVLDTVSFDSVRGLWSWRLHRDGEVCATAARTYLRRFECRRAAGHFRAAIAAVSLDVPVVRIVRTEVLDRYEAADSAGGAAVAS